VSVAARPAQAVGAAVEAVSVEAFQIPTDQPESDGTFAWDSTTVVVVEIAAGGERGLGYTYGPKAVGALVEELLADVVIGRDALDVHAAWAEMGGALRNAGRPGIGAMAVAAVDIALWDAKARLLGLPLVRLLDAARSEVPVYGSGGFTSYSNERLADQLGSWVADGIPRVKMKLGRDPSSDPARLDAARSAIGDEAELFVDANGAFTGKQALGWANRYRREWGVSWFEEPVSSADFAGLRLLRDEGPRGLDIAAGEYGYVLADFRNLLEAGAVDCLQADVTRCGGITGLLQVAGLAAGHGIDLSGHCAPAVSVPALCAVERLRHLEWFHDHVRVEAMLFDGVPELTDGNARPDLDRPGHGLELKRADAARYAA
jgi:L-alanine-DL-glutamate epimerase-like enolase superfamily enzyme